MRAVRIAVIVLVLVFVSAFGYSAYKNPEKAPLDAAARVDARGTFVSLPGGVTHYEVAGPDTGRVVVLVHGFSVPMYIWDSTFTALSNAGYRVIRYDLYGRGLSDRPDAAYDGAMYDAQLDGLLDSLHVQQPIDLLGLSFGGYVTAHYVSTHAARVRTLTLVDPISSSGPMPAMFTTPMIGPWIWQVTVVPGMAAGQASDFLHPEHFPEWAEFYRPQMRFVGFGRALLRTRLGISTTNWDSLYAAVAKTGIPVELIWGKQDQTVKFELSDVVRRNIPAVEFVPVDSAGHLPHIEQAPLFNQRLLAFFAAHPARQ